MAAAATSSRASDIRSVSIVRGVHTNKTAGIADQPSPRIAVVIATMVVITTDNIVVTARVDINARLPRYGEPLFITHDSNVCTDAIGSSFWDGCKTPVVCNSVTAGAFAMGVVVENQPRQLLIDLGLLMISVCVRGRCTARLDGPGSCYSNAGVNGRPPPLPGDTLLYTTTKASHCIGTINAITETFYHKEPKSVNPPVLNGVTDPTIVAVRHLYGTISVIVAPVLSTWQNLCGAG